MLGFSPSSEPIVHQHQGNAGYSTPYSFTANTYDELSSLVYMGARYYSPKYSIFTSVDPMKQLRSWIRPYNYVQNNPIMRQDPTGMLDTGPGGDKEHTVQDGETLYCIAETYNLTVQELRELNGIDEDDDHIEVGQILTVSKNTEGGVTVGQKGSSNSQSNQTSGFTSGNAQLSGNQTEYMSNEGSWFSWLRSRSSQMGINVYGDGANGVGTWNSGLIPRFSIDMTDPFWSAFVGFGQKPLYKDALPGSFWADDVADMTKALSDIVQIVGTHSGGSENLSLENEDFKSPEIDSSRKVKIYLNYYNAETESYSNKDTMLTEKEAARLRKKYKGAAYNVPHPDNN